MKKGLITVLAVLGILGAGYGVMVFLEKNGPVAPKKEREVLPVAVETVTVRAADVAVALSAEGLVAARRKTVISAEVSGRVMAVDAEFERGGKFSEGEVMLRLDKTDYEAARAEVEASLAEARLALETEKARGAQAARDWKKLGRGGEPSDMVLRKPNVASARARAAAEEAALEKARRDLKRTELRAPYDCRVRAAEIGPGAVVSPGMRLGEIYELGNYEVRLPFSLQDFGFLNREGAVTLSARVGGEEVTWKGDFLRDEGDVNRETLSAYVYVGVEENGEAPEGFRLPPPGLFVRAELAGKTLRGVFPLRRELLRGRDEVMVVDEDSRLRFRKVEVRRAEEDLVYISDGLSEGERVCATKVERPVAGMKVVTVGDGGKKVENGKEN